MDSDNVMVQINKELELLTDSLKQINYNLKRIADNTKYLRIKGGN